MAMSILPDAAQLDPEALAKRWFSYIVGGVLAIVFTSALLVHSKAGTPATSVSPAQVGATDPEPHPR